jgi:ubiquitin C-terminal hydrolase
LLKTFRDTLKRTLIKTLPNTLIIHLKRFEFNLDTMRKVKLNDYCEFPMALNMFPYTTEAFDDFSMEVEEEKEGMITSHCITKQLNMFIKENEENEENEESIKVKQTKPAEYYTYSLVGVLVHSGNADGGHYYSFIKVNGSTHRRNTIDTFVGEIRKRMGRIQ